MRMETYIMGMKAHCVTEVVETEEGWIARVDRRLRIRDGQLGGFSNLK